MTARMQERFAAYCELRDGGMRDFDAAAEVGIGSRSARGYEAAYRSARGLPENTAGYRKAVALADDARKWGWSL